MLRPQSSMPSSIAKKKQCPAEKLLQEKKLLNAEKSFNIHIDKLAYANQDYFDHLAGKCICAICICGFHRCNARQLKLDSQFKDPTTYQEHYDNKHPSKELSKNLLDPQLWKAPSINNPIEFNTTYRTTYTRPQSAMPTISKGPGDSEPKSRIPLITQSHYKDTFLNWPGQKTPQMEPLHNTGIIKELPFHGETSYGKEFLPKNGDSQKEIDKMMNEAKFSKFKFYIKTILLYQRSPIASNVPFLSQTTSGSAFQPFKAFKYNNLKYYSKVIFLLFDSKNIIQPSLKFPAYLNQYRTQYTDDYYDKGKKICPASFYVKGSNFN